MARKRTRAEARALEIDIIGDVWRAFCEFGSSRSKYEFATALVDATQASYDANLDSYRQGLSTIVELLTAQRDLANAGYTLIQSKADLLAAYAAVAYTTGYARLP
jgi:outer membrane protein